MRKCFAASTAMTPPALETSRNYYLMRFFCAQTKTDAPIGKSMTEKVRRDQQSIATNCQMQPLAENVRSVERITNSSVLYFKHRPVRRTGTGSAS